MSWSVLLFFFIGQTFAEVQLQPIKVEATKEISVFSFSHSTTIPSSALETDVSPLTAPQLEKVSGIVANQNGGPGGRISYFFRGTESRHVAFTLDGLKLNDPSNNDRQFDSAFFTSPFLKEMDIHLGPQSVMFGSDALGGLVELKSRKGEAAPETRFILNGGSFGTVSSSLSHDWKAGSQRGSLTATRFYSDGISRLNKKRFNGKERDGADITQITSSSQHRWQSKMQTDFLFSFLRGKNELDGVTDDNSHDESENDQYIVQQKTQYEMTSDSAFYYRVGLNRHQRRIDTLSVSKESYQGDLIQNEIIHRLQAGKLGVVSGVSTDHEDLKIKSVDRKFDLHSLFLQSSLDFNALKFQGGIRVDLHTTYGQFYSSTAGLALEKMGSLFSIQYSQGFKAPSLYQLYAIPLFGTPIGNPNLEPERNNSLEASWKKEGDSYEGRLTIFQNRLSKLITFSNQGFVNQRSFISEGMEAAFLYKLTHFEFGPSMNHQAFRKTESEVLRRPYNIASLNLSYLASQQIIFSSRLNWQDSRKDLDQNGTVVKLNPYETVDLVVKYLMEKYDFGLQVSNLFNREYENLYGYSIMPRAVFFHVGYKF